jgi:hypothetical protein
VKQLAGKGVKVAVFDIQGLPKGVEGGEDTNLFMRGAFMILTERNSEYSILQMRCHRSKVYRRRIKTTTREMGQPQYPNQ